MSLQNSPADIVARFLRANNFSETLVVFLKEAGLPANAGSLDTGSLTVEQILHEKQLYDLSINFEKTGVDERTEGWTSPAPSVPSIVKLPSTANILQVSMEMFEVAGQVKPLLVVTTADRRLTLLDPRDSFHIVRSTTQLQDSPILSYVILSFRYVVCGSMSGSVVIYDFKLDQTIAKRKDHSKYVVRLATFDAGNGHTWIASAGWDRRVFIYDFIIGNDGTPLIQEPMAYVELATNPEAILLARDPDSTRLHLVLTRRDSTIISFYDLSYLPVQDTDRPGTTSVSLTGQQNLAPHSNAWIAFTPAAMALCPTDRSQVAVATSAVPHMKVLVVRLLFPKEKGQPFAPLVDTQIRVGFTQQDREDAAVLLHSNAFAPQTAYSTPAITWRPDGSGLWVNSDDGIIRGLETRTGRVMSNLERHELGCKIRCLWAGWVNISAQSKDVLEELVISGGFDQHLIAWRTPHLNIAKASNDLRSI